MMIQFLRLLSFTLIQFVGAYIVYFNHPLHRNAQYIPLLRYVLTYIYTYIRHYLVFFSDIFNVCGHQLQSLGKPYKDTVPYSFRF